MGTAQLSNPQQRTKLNLLVQETLERRKTLPIMRVSIELGINHEAARSLMMPYVEKGLAHYNRHQQTYLPNSL